MSSQPVATSTALSVMSSQFPPAVMHRVGEITSLMCAANQRQVADFDSFIASLKGELEQVQSERRECANKVHELEVELEGMRQAHGVMQATLQRVEKENGQFQADLTQQTTLHHGVRAELEIALREKNLAQTSLAEQQLQLDAALRGVANKQRLGVKVEERRALEMELKKVEAELDAKQGGILDTLALACGAVLSLLTSWVLGLIIGLGGRKLVSSLMADNVNCPCTTPLYACQASIQGQLRLVNEEIERLKLL